MSEICCETFKKVSKSFSWFSYSGNGNSILCMPNIQVGEIKYRVNHCPSCGAEIRDIEVSVSEFSKW